MGFLDKLLGRSKDVAGSVTESAQDMGDKAAGAVSPDGREAFELDEGESQVTESEHRLDDVRDQVLRDEDRMP
ncbi:MAG TPA: hypothetical protein VD769_13205 [Gaiellaceae bacterium]|nr:hypothetical protein [Gaiellaceae bacterium]